MLRIRFSAESPTLTAWPTLTLKLWTMLRMCVSRREFQVYYKVREAPEMLCAMDLWKAGLPQLSPPAPGETGSSEFSIVWDRHRLFRAESPADCTRWVDAIRRVQAQRPTGTPVQPGGASPAFLTPGGGPVAAQSGGSATPTPSKGGGGAGGSAAASEWGKSSARSGGGGGGANGRAGGQKGDDDRGGGGGGFCSNCVVS